MAMTRREALAATVVGGLVMTGAARTEERPLIPDQPARLTDGERQRLEKAGLATVKQFAAALRERFSDEKAGALRKFIDPRYLKAHGLQDGAFPIQRVVTGEIYDNQLSDDPTTALIIVETEGKAKECLLFRLTVHEEKVYISPLSAPDKKSKSFSPWILRVKL